MSGSNPRIPFQLSTDRPALRGPAGKRIIVHIVLNVEHWPFDAPVPRTILTPPHGRQNVPDVPNFSWAEYGNRAGMPRLLAALRERGLPASANVNAAVIDVYPTLAEAMLKAGVEFVGHGYHQRSLDGEGDEAALIGASLDRIQSFTGVRPRGWLGPGLRETVDTPDLLRAAGVDYVMDWVLDDLPCWMTTKHGPLLAAPYALELNDSVVYAVEKHASPEMHRRIADTIACFEREAHEQPRVLTLALHPHLTGVPHRIAYLERTLDELSARDDVFFLNGSSLTDWYAAEVPPRA